MKFEQKIIPYIQISILIQQKNKGIYIIKIIKNK
jgi:hypothetical protein